MTKVKPHGEPDLRTLFLRAAMEILEERDTPLDLRKVAEQAGKSRTAPYLVFGKEKDGGGLIALRLAVAAQGLQHLLRDVSATQSPDKSALSILHEWALAFFEFAIGNPRLFRLMFGPEIAVAAPLEGRSDDHPELNNLVNVRTELEGSLMNVLESCQQERLLDLGNILGKTRAAWATIQGIALLLLDDILLLKNVETSAPEAADIATEAIVGTTYSALTHSASLLLKAQAAQRQPRELEDEVMGFALRQDAMPLVAEPAAEWGAPPVEIPSSLRRALKSRVAVQGARILWIDDHPEWSDWEHRVLEELGTHVIWATTTEKALEILASESIDLILSDIARGDDEQAGLSGLTQIRQVRPDTPLVFYVSDLDEEKGPPAGSSGITNRPDELLHLVLDVLERGRG